VFDLNKQLVDKQISRRSFIKRLTQTGMSLAGADAVAAALGSPAVAAELDIAQSGIEASKFHTNLTGGELMAEFLIDWDIPYVFGLAGSEEVGFLDALVDRPQIDYATCIHENTAMAMADGYSRSTGKTSFVCLHSVAGAAYALGQIVTSYRDRVPVVVAVGRQSTDFRGTDGFLEAPNLHTLPRDYAQWIWDVMSAETIPEVLRRAFILSEAPPGGPSFVTFSKDLWEKRVDRGEIIPRSRSVVSYDVEPPEDHVDAIADALLERQMPLFFLGNEGVRQEISQEVGDLAEAVGALVMTGNKTPQIFPNTHPNYVGQHPIPKEISQTFDTFWAIGAPMFKLSNLPAEPYVSRNVMTFQTGWTDFEVGRNYPVDSAAIASIKTTAAAVLEEVKSRQALSSRLIKDRRQWVHEYNARRRAELQKMLEQRWDDRPISAERVGVELDRRMDERALVVNELLTSEGVVRDYIKFDHQKLLDERRKNCDTTAGILGWGIGAAIGAKIGNPDRETWCLTADGSANFGIQSLWSAARYDVPIGIIVFNNGHYQANRLNFARYNGRMRETNKYIGVNLGHPDIGYVQLAAGYGIEAERVEDPKDLAAAIDRCKKAMDEGRPYLIDVKIGTVQRIPGWDMTYYDHFSVAQTQ
jgi:thiamine pyrophosphate-dependent acetolactate synthase large subunit-like protein